MGSRKLLFPVALLAIVCAGVLGTAAGCAASNVPSAGESGTSTVYHDGVKCIVWRSGGGISCDFGS